MAAYENVRNVSVQVAVVNRVPAALMYRFAKWKNGGVDREVVTHVPGAAGAVAHGILAMRADPAVVDGFATSSIALPDGGIALVELGEAVTDITVPLRIGGNSSEVDGAAYLANAQGDYIVGYPLQTGAVGDIIEFQFLNGGLVP